MGDLEIKDLFRILNRKDALEIFWDIFFSIACSAIVRKEPIGTLQSDYVG